MSNELVSIVIPVYNCERFILETIQSVQKQSVDNWELILVNDCSTDKSAEVIKEASLADSRIKLISHETNKGAASARNTGVMQANGRYLCYLDSDDLWKPDKLEKELMFIEEKKAGFIFSGYEFADENGVGLGKIVHVPETISYKEALGNTTIFTSTVMMDLTILSKEDCMMPLIASEDTATWWKILKKYKIGYGLDENLVNYRRAGKSLSSNKFVAMKRIWNLYRKQEKLNVIVSAYNFVLWAFRAVFRRV